MLLAQSRYSNDMGTAGRLAGRPALSWTRNDGVSGRNGSTRQSGVGLKYGHGTAVTVKQSVLAKFEALRSWVSGSPDYGRHAHTLWRGAQQDTLQLLMSDLRDTLWEKGLPGIVEQLMGKDPLEKQILLQKLIQTVGPGDESRQQLTEFARSTASLEKSALDFLDNTVSAFSALDSIVFDGARLLRLAVHEISEASQLGDVKATSLARAILSKLHETHFDSAVHVLREGIKSDRYSPRPSSLSVQLLCLLTEKSKFTAVRLGVRVANDLCQQLVATGIRGYLSSEDLARVLLIGAETGRTELPPLLVNYLGAEVCDSVCARSDALENFKQAFIALPFTLWSPESIHRRDDLLANIDRLVMECVSKAH